MYADITNTALVAEGTGYVAIIIKHRLKNYISKPYGINHKALLFL